MGIKNANKVVRNVVDGTSARNCRIRRNPANVVIFDVSSLFHRYNTWLLKRKRASVETLADITYTSAEIIAYATKIMACISKDCYDKTTYLVFDAVASVNKKRTAPFVDSPEHDWASPAGLHEIANDYNAGGNSRGPLVRLLQNLYKHDWANSQATIDGLCEKSCSTHLVELLQGHPWGASVNRHLTTMCIEHIRPPTKLAVPALKELCAAMHPSWHIVQADGEADHEIAKISSQHNHGVVIVGSDTDFILITCARDLVWSTTGKRKASALGTEYSPIEFWECALGHTFATAMSTNYKPLVRHLEEFTTFAERPDERYTIWHKMVFAIASNLLAGKSDYHSGVPRKGTVKTSGAILAGAYDASTLDTSLTYPVLTEWYDYLMTFGSWLPANSAKMTERAIRAVTEAVEIGVATLDESGYIWITTREDFVEACIEECRYIREITPEDVQVIIAKTLPSFLLML